MIGMKIKVEDNTKAVAVAGEKAAYKNFRHGAQSLSKDMKASIVTSEEAAPVGHAPHTKGKGGHNLRGAIRYFSDKEGAIVGPLASIVGEAGAAHEHGEEFHGTDFPERPFAGPSLDRNEGRLMDDWRGSIGN